jgi:hypothetical protein
MPASEGNTQITFQVPTTTYEKLEKECARIGLKKGEFLSRLVVLYFVTKEMGMSRDVFDFFVGKK